jgi:hypothetical protein
MSRTAESDTQSLASRALSMGTTPRIALVDSGTEAALAEEADIEVGAARTGDPEECVAAGDATDALAITCDADLRVGWGELDEWLGRS